MGIAEGEPAYVSLPDETTFLTCVNEFYAAALMHARMLVRDEPIKAKFRDWDMKTRLFTMIAWSHVAGTATTVTFGRSAPASAAGRTATSRVNSTNVGADLLPMRPGKHPLRRLHSSGRVQIE